jgi:PadR family transcriptional regulator, regulatory protein PadR
MARLAEFELRVLLTVLRCGDDAYAVAVHDELKTRSKQHVSLGAIYITLDRLARKGLLSSRLGEPTAARGGRAKRYYTVTKRAVSLLKIECGAMQRLWSGLGLVEEP